MQPLDLCLHTLLLLLPAPQSSLAPSSPEPTAARMAWSDFDADGLPDLAVVRPDGARLLRNLGAGRFEDATSLLGQDVLPGARVALWADLDGEAGEDLLVAGEPGARLWVLDGRGGFRETTQPAGLGTGLDAVTAVTCLDLDADGRLDLQLTTPRGELLLRNTGNAVFEPVDLGLPDVEPGTVAVLRTPREEPRPAASAPERGAAGRGSGSQAVTLLFIPTSYGAVDVDD